MRGLVRSSHALNPTRISLEFGIWDLGFGIFWYRVRGYAKGGDADSVEFVGIAA